MAGPASELAMARETEPMADAPVDSTLADSEVGESIRGANHRSVERWSVLWIHGLEVRSVLRANLDMGLRGIEAGFHTG